jgi:hypothetical protein
MGQLQITKAYYGAQTIQSVNLTAWVQNQAASHSNSFSIYVDPSTFGINDPASGQRKSLVIHYNYGGNGPTLIKSAVDGENITLDTTINDISIVSACYGSNNVFVEITTRMQEFVTFNNGNQNINIGSNLFKQWFTSNGDIDPGIAKSLEITFIRNGQQYTVCANDGYTLSLMWHF